MSAETAPQKGHMQQIQRMLEYTPSSNEQITTSRRVYTAETATDKELGALAVSIHPSYQATFGSREKWGEGAIDTETNRIICIEDFFELPPIERMRYKLYYPLKEFIQRFIHEQKPIGDEKTYISIAQSANNDVVGAAWGIQTHLNQVLERIGIANYSQTEGGAEQWKQVSEKLNEDVLRFTKGNVQNIIYWDEVYVASGAEGMGVGSNLMGEMLNSFIQESTDRTGVTILFRTSEAQKMGKIAQLFERLGYFKSMRYEEDDENIVYYIGHLPPALISVAKVLRSNNVFRSLLAAARALSIKQNS